MKLKNNFYKEMSITQTGNSTDCIIELDPLHEIFKAHFPENPIVPGVLIMQMVVELAEEVLSTSLSLEKIAKIKYQNVIDPRQNPQVRISMQIEQTTDLNYTISAKVFNNEMDFSQLTLLLMKEV